MTEELWLVEVDGKEYKADEATLREWIRAGRVTGDHRVKRGHLPWTAARLVPPLRGLFGRDDEAVSQPTKARIIVSTGSLPANYEIIDTIFAIDSSPEKVFRSDHVDDAFLKVLEKLRERCRDLGGDAVIDTQFEYRSAVDGIFGKAQVMEFFAYGTAVRLLGDG